MSYQQRLEETCDGHKRPMSLEHAPLMIAISRICGDADAELSRLRADCQRKDVLLKEIREALVHRMAEDKEIAQDWLIEHIDLELKEPHAT